MSEPVDIQAPGALWDAVEKTEKRWTKSFDRGQFKGTAVDALYNVRRLSHILGPVGFAWGWEIASERLDTFGLGEDQQVIHTCVLRVWFRQPDGSYRHCEHLGHTKASYWTRPRQSGDKPRFVVDDEFGKKSVTDALSKVMVNLGASADIWLGRFDGNKYVSYDEEAGNDASPPVRQRVAPDQGDSDGDRLARASRPGAAPPPEDDRGQPTFVLDGVRLTGEDWIAAAVLTAKRLQPSALIVWWEGAKDERAKLHRLRPDLNERLDKLKAKVLAKAATFNGTVGPGHVSPDQAVRAG